MSVVHAAAQHERFEGGAAYREEGRVGLDKGYRITAEIEIPGLINLWENSLEFTS